MAIDGKPGIETLVTATTLAATDANTAGVSLSKADFMDMTDGAVSSKDLAIAKGWVDVLTGYLDEGSYLHQLTKAGETRLPKDLAPAKAQEMLTAAKELHSAISAQRNAQSRTATMWEETKDQFRTPVRFLIRAAREYFGSNTK